jgi:hypothetical protein
MESTPWVQVLVQMVHGPDAPARGVVRRVDPDNRPRQILGWASTASGLRRTPTAGVDAAELRVWRDEMRVRVEKLDGTVVLLSDGTTCWRFESGRDRPVAAPADALLFLGNGTELLARRPAQEWVGNDFTRPVGPITATVFLDRPAWEFELAPPPRKPHPMQMVVDQETGLVLQQRTYGLGVVDEWVELTVGEVFDESLFVWDGAADSAEDESRRMRAAGDERRAERRNWFRTRVTGESLLMEVVADLNVDYVHTFDDHTGAFEASLGDRAIKGSLARRLRSSRPWELRWSGPVYRWSTADFDWAVAVHDTELPAAGLAALQARLHPGVPVVDPADGRPRG